MDNNELLQAISIMMDEKLEPIKDDIIILKEHVKQLNKKVDKLERNDKFILDEIERVHEQLIDHIKDNSKHIA